MQCLVIPCAWKIIYPNKQQYTQVQNQEFPYFVEFHEKNWTEGKTNASKQKCNSLVSDT